MHILDPTLISAIAALITAIASLVWALRKSPRGE